MSSRVNYKYDEQGLSERSYNREENYGRSSSPYRLIDEPSVEFSFKQLSQNGEQIMQRSCSLYKSQSIISLKQNLQQLPKSQIIELLIQQINFSQSNPSQRQRLNETLKEINKPKNDINSKKEDTNYKIKYDELVRDFQEYINNTRQAQQHYVKIIEDLKRQNKTLESQLNKKSKDTQYSPNYSPRSHPNKSAMMIEKLQQSVQNYIKINNELIGKVQKLERQNKQITEEIMKFKQDNQFLKQQNQFMIKENEKLKKQNTSFKSIVDELKDYIMERREAKEQVGNNCDTQRSNVSQNGQIRQNQKKYEMQKYADDSIINSSQIKRRQLTLNDSTIMFQKDSQNIQYRDREQKRYNKLQQNQYNQAQSEIYSKTQETLKMVQAENKMLKITNQKLEQLLQKKSEKVKTLIEQIQALKTQASMANQQVIDLKCKMKKNHSNSYIESTTASKATNNQDFKLSGNKNQIYTRNNKNLKDSSSQAFVKRYSHCAQSQLKRKQDISNFQIHQQNKSDENRQRKTFNLESFNLLKGQIQTKSTHKDRQVQRNNELYYIPKTLIVSNKKF